MCLLERQPKIDNMNVYHYALLFLQLVAFLINLHKNGELKPERDFRYNATTAFYSLVIAYTLVILSAYKLSLIHI